MIRRPDDQGIVGKTQLIQPVKYQATSGINHGDVGVGARDDLLPLAPVEIARRRETSAFIGQSVMGILPKEFGFARQRIGEAAVLRDVFRIIQVGELFGREAGLMRPQKSSRR